MEHLSGVGRNSSVDDRQLTGPWPEVTNLLTGQCPGTLRPLWKGGITETARPSGVPPSAARPSGVL